MCLRPRCQSVLISIHALTRSATIQFQHQQQHRFYFNPRTHEECDYGMLYLLVEREDFNPRTHEECDLMQSLMK